MQVILKHSYRRAVIALDQTLERKIRGKARAAFGSGEKLGEHDLPGFSVGASLVPTWIEKLRS
jgi:hypothetical protein